MILRSGLIEIHQARRYRVRRNPLGDPSAAWRVLVRGGLGCRVQAVLRHFMRAARQRFNLLR